MMWYYGMTLGIKDFRWVCAYNLGGKKELEGFGGGKILQPLNLIQSSGIFKNSHWKYYRFMTSLSSALYDFKDRSYIGTKDNIKRLFTTLIVWGRVFQD